MLCLGLQHVLSAACHMVLLVVILPVVQASNSILEGTTSTPSYTHSNADHAAEKVTGHVPDSDNDYDSWEYMTRDTSATSSRLSRDFVMHPLGS